MSLIIDIKIIRPWNCAGSAISFMNFGTSSTSSNVVNPGKLFHSNSIGSPSMVSKVLYCGVSLNQSNCSSQALFDVGFWLTFPRHNTESENTWTFWCERLVTSSSLTKDYCFHGESSQLIWDTPPKISTFEMCRTFSLKWDLNLYFWWNVNFRSNSFPWIQMLPMSKTKIHQIIGRLSMSCNACFEKWSNIFRNRSFTLFKNDRDLRERFDSVTVSESISSSMTNLSSTGLFVLAPNISPDFHSRPLVVNVPFWVVWWASAHHRSPCSCLLLIQQAQR